MESLDDPVSSCDGILHSVCDDAALGFHQVLDLNHSLVLVFYEEFVEFFSELVVEDLEAVLEHQLQQSASAFHSLVAVVIAIIEFRRVIQALDELLHH